MTRPDHSASASTSRVPSWLIMVGTVACMLGFILSSWLPATLEWQLASIGGEQGLRFVFWARMGLLLLLSAGLIWVVFGPLWDEEAKDIRGSEKWVFARVWVVFGVFIALVLIPGFNSNYKMVEKSAVAAQKVKRVEQVLGRSTPAGDEVRRAVVSLEALRENQALVEKIASSSTSPKKAMDVLSASLLLGEDHPVIQFTANNGLVQGDAYTIIYRDLTDHVRQNPDAANDARVSALVMRFSGR